MAKKNNSTPKGSATVVMTMIVEDEVKKNYYSNVYKARFFTRINHSIFCIGIEDILYFIFEDGVTTLVTIHGRNYVIKYSLETLEDLLDPMDFFRINRRCITKIDSIKKINILSKSRLEVILKNDSKEIVSRSKNTSFRTWLDC